MFNIKEVNFRQRKFNDWTKTTATKSKVPSEKSPRYHRQEKPRKLHSTSGWCLWPFLFFIISVRPSLKRTKAEIEPIEPNENSPLSNGASSLVLWFLGVLHPFVRINFANTIPILFLGVFFRITEDRDQLYSPSCLPYIAVFLVLFSVPSIEPWLSHDHHSSTCLNLSQVHTNRLWMCRQEHKR